MQAVGLIAEFNPLHNGHVYALAQARAISGATVVVVVMAGNFVQRGEPSIVDKWTRAQAALAAGADVVVELPTTDAVQAAGPFAAGAVAILAALGVDLLAFGSEAPGVDYAKVAAKMAATPPKRADFQTFNATYATQLNAYYSRLTGVNLTQPNLMLGMSYAQANEALGRPMRLVPFARQVVAHDAPDTIATLASASAVRAALTAGNSVADWVPPAMAAGLASQPILGWDAFWPLLRYRLQTSDLEALREVYTMTEGLEYRLTQQVEGAGDFATFMAAIKSKRFTFARMRRLSLYTLLNYTATAVAEAQAHRFIHLLGFTAAGRAWLHTVKKRVRLPLITKPSLPMLAPGGIMALQHRADRLIETQTGEAQNFGRAPLIAP